MPRKRAGKGKKRKKSKGRTTSRSPSIAPDPSDTDDVDTRYVQPYEATKTYLCPGCNQAIPPGTGHMVAVPPEAPDLRRHWHRGCWVNRKTRY